MVKQVVAKLDNILLQWAGVADHDPSARATAQGNCMDAANNNNWRMAA